MSEHVKPAPVTLTTALAAMYLLGLTIGSVLGFWLGRWSV